MSGWCEIPEDLFEKISNLCLVNDCIQISNVCKSWRFFMKKTRPWCVRPQVPWLMMLPEDEEIAMTTDSRDLYDPLLNKIHAACFPGMPRKRCCGSFSNGWLMMEGMEGNVSLFNPWRKKEVELINKSALKLDYPSQRVRISRAALSDDLNEVFIIYRKFLGGLDFAFCRAADNMVGYWTFNFTSKIPFVDMVYHTGKFYGIKSNGTIYLVKRCTPIKLKRLTRLPLKHACWHCMVNLVPADSSTESMFVVVRSISRKIESHECIPRVTTVSFDVYQVFLKWKNLFAPPPVKVKTLGDRVMFLGNNSSFLVMAREIPGFSKPDRIYYVDNYMDPIFDRKNPTGHKDVSVFNMEDGTIEPLVPNRFHPTSLSSPLWIATSSSPSPPLERGSAEGSLITRAKSYLKKILL